MLLLLAAEPDVEPDDEADDPLLVRSWSEELPPFVVAVVGSAGDRVTPSSKLAMMATFWGV